MKRFPAGSEWRKWDLHVHVPGTKLNCGYGKSGTEQDFDEVAAFLEGSDVMVFGITDYFSADQSLRFIKFFKNKYPESEKLLLVNVELRLNETVSKDLQTIDFHIIFSDGVPDTKIAEFLAKLPTQITDANSRPKSCSELSGNDYNTVTVTRDHIKNAFKETFGEKAEPTDYLIYLTPANNNGIRAESGKQRKANLADEIDKDVHAIFGKGVDNSSYFLKTDRYEDASLFSKPKPVFGGCDAHNLRDLKNWLGKAVEDENTRQVITWVKADPTFEGLQQTLVEPADRVSLSELRPDAKDPYKVIRQVTFKGGTDFPEAITLNENLCAIIGSRSSGKSALLAHIAHAVDQTYTVQQQCLATGVEEKEAGPAAGWSWDKVASTTCEVEWAGGSINGGRVIYIPQNWLYQLSANPSEVTEKIKPVLEARYPDYFRGQQRLLDSVKMTNYTIDKDIENWFGGARGIVDVDSKIKQVGDKNSITKERDNIHEQLESLRSTTSLSLVDLEHYQKIVDDIGVKNRRLDEIAIEIEQLAPYIQETSSTSFDIKSGTVSAEIIVTPSTKNLPSSLVKNIDKIVTQTSMELKPKLVSAITAYREKISTEEQTLRAAIDAINKDNNDLISRHTANTTLDELVKREKTQNDSLVSLQKLGEDRDVICKQQSECVQRIESQLQKRESLLNTLKSDFNEKDRQLDQLHFDIVSGFDSTFVSEISEPFRKNLVSTFLTKDRDDKPVVDIQKAQSSPAIFLKDLFSSKQKLNQGNDPQDVARRVLTATPEIRFAATLDGDGIGGFERSTMTPGKQALFALTLILGESTEEWPLLIDQPEDDLDSRSIYNDIVSFLVKQKKLRQIILVTHNANLVVGADSEEVLVANRQGNDRKNQDGRTFDYLTGSLEYSEAEHSSTNELERQGIREFAVEILDGGEEAFEKRRDKYKL